MVFFEHSVEYGVQLEGIHGHGITTGLVKESPNSGKNSVELRIRIGQSLGRNASGIDPSQRTP